MATALDTLTEKEKDALRLLLRGHDAKSSARELGLSVHTVNERLRDARRKLGVTSSREAARRLLAEESGTPGSAPEMLGDKPMGDAAEGRGAATSMASATRRQAGPHPALILAGVTAMSLVVAALFLPSSPLPMLAPAALTETVAGAEPATDTRSGAAADTAEAFLAMLDQSRWADSYAATSAEFRSLNTLKAWSDVSARLRPPLGEMLTRDIVRNEYVPAPPMGYRLVKFRSSYANGTRQTESVSLAWEEGAWKVAGITFD